LERRHELDELAAAARDAAAGAGSVVLISGEAGIGKSTLVRAIRLVLPPDGRLLVGYCDDLATPRVLGPLRDLVGSVGGELTRALDAGDRGRVPEALRHELDRSGRASVLCVEDVHWADEASLDVLLYLVRRVADLPAVLVLTYRDDEAAGDGALRRLLGQASRTERVRRLPLARLSADAVRQLSAARGLDAADVYAVTAGNPFFVTEVLAAGDADGVPATIADAVLARVARLDPATRDVVERLAVVPSTVDGWLVNALVPGGFAALAPAEECGLVWVAPTGVAFRHELTRRAVADAMPAARRVERNRRVLAALLARPGADLSRIVHHATEAGDLDTVWAYGPGAAREAAAAGGHREAAAHYRLVLEQRDRFPVAERAELLERYAVELYTVGQADLAVSVLPDAVALRRSLGDPVALGATLRWLSRLCWWAGDRPGAEVAGDEAVAVLEPTGDPATLALALSNRAQLHALAGELDPAVAVGERAVAMARALGDGATLSHALNNVGLARWQRCEPAGRELLDESLRVALDAGAVEHACRAYVNLIWNLIEDLDLEEARRRITAAFALAGDTEHLGFAHYLSAELAMLRLATGEWDDVEAAAQEAVAGQPTMASPALTALARLAVRRGRADADALLTRAWTVAEGIGELLRTGPVVTARAEAAWLRGEATDGLAGWYAQARRHGSRAIRAELACWHARAGGAADEDGDHPYALLASGRWREAAQAWQAAGMPYERALALADSPDPADLLTALGILDRLGAEPLARIVRGRLRERGVSRIPRGPAAATRGHPAGLTGRQAEVARLLADGLSNAEIAQRLVLSVRTVDNHVAAVLDKLGARNRREVTARAYELGVEP
jgi:DNA-binding CsgD family transcriptional regulator/tetratricopeptide (TPR) repeat protein